MPSSFRNKQVQILSHSNEHGEDEKPIVRVSIARRNLKGRAAVSSPQPNSNSLFLLLSNPTRLAEALAKRVGSVFREIRTYGSTRGRRAKALLLLYFLTQLTSGRRPEAFSFRALVRTKIRSSTARKHLLYSLWVNVDDSLTVYSSIANNMNPSITEVNSISTV